MLRLLLPLLILAGCSASSEVAPDPTPTPSGPQLSASEAIAIVQTWLTQRQSSAGTDCLDYHLRRPAGFEAKYWAGGRWNVTKGDNFSWWVYERSHAVAVDKRLGITC